MSFALGRYIHIKRNNTMETFPAGVSIFEAAFSALVDVAGAVRLLFKKYSILIKRNSLVSSFSAQKDITGKGCKLTEPIYGTQFDLNELHSEIVKTGKSVVDQNDHIEFNVCGNDTRECGPAKTKAQACFKKGGKYYWFGK